MRGVLVLQWDRAFDGAEMARDIASRANIALLQWDRAFDGAEIMFAINENMEDWLLQWDRAFDGAEISWRVPDHRRPDGGFNGTAPLMARKWLALP